MIGKEPGNAGSVSSRNRPWRLFDRPDVAESERFLEVLPEVGVAERCLARSLSSSYGVDLPDLLDD